MVNVETLYNLSGSQLALWAYLRQYGIDEIIHVDDVPRRFPFARHLFRDVVNLNSIFIVLVNEGLLTVQPERENTYKRVQEEDPDRALLIIYNRVIKTDRSFIRDKIVDIIRDIQLHEFLELEDCLSRKSFQDPFLVSFSEDIRLGRKEWWKSVCHLSHLYDQAAQGRISDLFLNFVEVAALKLPPTIDDMGVFSSKIDKKFEKDEIVELEADVDDVTPYMAQMNIQFILAKWRDISLKQRDKIRSRALKSLLYDATLANIVLPVGNPNERDKETLRSTQLTIFTPEDSKDIFINNNPKDRFRELLRNRMDVEILSPYQVTGFVPAVMFFGRNEQLRLIAAHPETNYAIYGSRQSGKTSLMKHLERLYTEQQLVAFINSELVSCEADFFRLLSNALHIKTAKSYSEFEEAAMVIEHSPVLLIDEVDHVLETCNSKRILSTLRHLNGQYAVRCILAGTTELYKQYRDIRSPMYNFADPLPLGPFTELEAIDLAREPMLSLGAVYEKGDSTVKQLVNLCGRFPNLIQLMCHELIKEVKSQGTGKTITSRMVKYVFEGNTFGEQIYQQFHHNFNPYQKLIVYTSLMVKEMPLQLIADRVQSYYLLSIDRIEELLDELVETVLRLQGTKSCYFSPHASSGRV